MKAVFVDFEMNPIGRDQKEARRTCKGEIIEIGAVKIDEEGNEISAYKEYVMPEYTTAMNQTCQELTGITMEMLKGKPHSPKPSITFSPGAMKAVPTITRCMPGAKTTGVSSTANSVSKLPMPKKMNASAGCSNTGRIFNRFTAIFWGSTTSYPLIKRSAPLAKPSTAKCTTPCGMPATLQNYMYYPRRAMNSATSCSLSSTLLKSPGPLLSHWPMPSVKPVNKRFEEKRISSSVYVLRGIL